MDRRSLLTAGGTTLGALAISAVAGSATSSAATGDGFWHGSEQERRNLKTFDELDFDVFTNQKWARLGESHTRDIRVHWPDGHYTDGINKHIEDLKFLFIFAPDTNIRVHPIKMASGDLTSVTGVMKGTFTRPMPLPNGNTIQPTGKTFTLDMATVGHWRKGVMTEEWLFWDSQHYNTQLGIA
ncbi:ester cyclase [Umezawaea endophytica]|uniref:Ester cyclase n=1 Tax=Umezawaea endophytica TaxID=1654476 RepID=A0A9X2VS54_9PSEU|nr:ester cyclase [Umezawaea endophytica]MCS7481179.1 ester cyclase [Umezawaea endophytica]